MVDEDETSDIIKALDEIELKDELSDLISAEVAMQCMVIPLEQVDKTLTIAVADPLDFRALNRIQTTTKMQLQTVIAAPSQISKAHQALYASKKAYDEAREFIQGQASQVKEEDIASANAAADDQPIIRFVNNMIEEAYAEGFASGEESRKQENAFFSGFRPYPSPPRRSFRGSRQ